MRIKEAKAECERWLAHCDRQRGKSLALQKLAAERREGKVSAHEARSQLAEIEGGPGVRVYDGARLEQAVRSLLEHLRRGEER